ncbi:TPA: CS1-pili formation C-terminal domain-containing protein, partial [Aeromonas veronii]
YSFDGNWSSQLSLVSDRSGVSRGDVGVTRTMNRGGWTGTAIAATGWSRDLQDESSFSGIVNGATDWFNGSAYGYVNNTGQQMISGTLTGTQFLSADGVGVSNDLSSSFIRVIPDIKTTPGEKEVSLNDIHYNLRRGKRVTYQGNLGDSNAIIALEPYTDTEFVMDAETKSVDIEEPARREFVYPGTVYTIETRVTPLVSQLFVLSDLKGNPVQQVRCVGSGCQSVERLSDDGVFRVNYHRDGDIKLFSMNSLCINSPALSRKGVVYTYCLPGLDERDGRVAFSSHGGSVGKTELLYLGKYPVDPKAKDMLERLKAAGLTTHSVELGHYLYIYVQQSKEFTVVQRALLEDMDAYIVRNDADFNELFSVR